MRISLIAVAVLVLAGCTAKDSAAPSTAPQTSVATDPHTAGAPGEVAATPAPSHNYLSRDGDLYCYPAAVSQDAKEAGQAAEDVLCFRYGGKVNGAYVFTPERDPGTVISCDDPCKVIKFDVYGQTVKRVAFEPGSVIGAAFEDAMSGQLEALARATTAPAPVPTPASPPASLPPAAAPSPTPTEFISAPGAGAPQIAGAGPPPPGPAAAPQVPQAGPTFDCSRARAYAERMICSDPELAAADRRLLAAYREARARDPSGAVWRNARAAWHEREACQSRDCLVAWYAAREAEYRTAVGN
jgi:uncharacterized protein YecT (DUF1311 family)